MLSRFVEEGSKVELRALEHGLGESGAEKLRRDLQLLAALYGVTPQGEGNARHEKQTEQA